MQFKADEAKGDRAEHRHRWEEYAKRIAAVELKDEEEPVFGLVRDHTGRLTRRGAPVQGAMRDRGPS